MTEPVTVDVVSSIDEYLDRSDWRVNANANQGYSLGGLILNTAGKVIANYWLSQVYPADVGAAQDPKGLSGLAHMFEHMAFKGTPQIGTTNYPAEKKLLDELEELLDEAGYFFPPDRVPSTKRTLRTLLTKPGWNAQEVRTLRGVLSALNKPRPRGQRASNALSS